MNAVAQCITEAVPVISEGPELLRRSVPLSAPYPIDALGPTLGPAARRLHQVVKAPDAIGAQSALAAASLAVQHLADVEIDGRRHPLSLWCLTVAESGERKSAVDSLALRAHEEFERERSVRYREEMSEYKRAYDMWDAGVADAKKIKFSNDRLEAIEACGDQPELPLTPNLLCSEPTLEGLHRLFRDGYPSLGLFSDEGGQLFGGHAMNKDNISKSAAGLSKAWDGAPIDRIRAGDGASKIYGKRLASHLLMQPVIAEGVMSNDTLTGQGFLARSLPAWPAPTAGTRVYDSTDLTSDPAMLRFWGCMRTRLERQARLRDESRNELDPRPLPLSMAAKARWVVVYNKIEMAISPGQPYATIKAWASKAPEQIARIAGVLTLVADPDATCIEVPAITSAAELMGWYLDEAVRLVGMAATSPEIRRAEALLAWCKGQEVVYSSAMLQNGPNCIRESKVLEGAMSVLEASGWATFVEGGLLVDGKHRKKVWRMEPEVPA